MGEEIYNKQQELHEEKDMPDGSDALKKDDDSFCEDKTCVSSCQMCEHTQRCDQTSPFQSQTQEGHTDQRLLHLKDMPEHWHGIVDVTMSNGLNVICTAGSPVGVSPNIKSGKISNQSLGLYGKTRNSNMQVDFLIQYTSAFGHKKFTISPIDNCISEAWNEKAANFLKGSPIVKLGDRDSGTGSERVSLVGTTESNLIQPPNPPSAAIHCVPLQKPREETWPLGMWRSGLNVSDQMLVHFTRIHQSELSRTTPISKGLLHCFWRNGVPYFVFFDAEENGVLFANLWRFNASDARDPDYMYIFHYWTSCEAENHAAKSHIIGKMKVSSCLSFNSNGSESMEHEFVLFGVNKEQQRETQNSTLNCTKTKGLSKHIGNVFKANHLHQKKVPQKSSEIYLEPENFSQERYLNELHSMHPSLELAAIVVKEPQTKKRKDRTSSGWGLKFLEMACLDRSLNLSTSETCRTIENKYARSINVLIPAGLHGGMVTGTGRPSTLMERWSGRKCDCGGWDVGCPLSVLQNRSDHHKPFSPDPSAGDCNTVDLFLEGSRKQEPALRMVSLEDDLYAVYFQPNLSALQSFSVGVASIHTRIQSLLPDM